VHISQWTSIGVKIPVSSKIKIALLTVLFLPVLVLISSAQTSNVLPKTAVAAPDPSLAKVANDPTLPRILLIGDSISMGYTIPVRNLLKGKANVHRIPENGGPTTNGLAKLQSWLGDDNWDVIHFNWGLHDLRIMPDGLRQVSPEAYEKNLRKLVQQLKATKATLIWASTTPVPEGVKNPIRHPTDVSAYNGIAKKIMDEQRIAIDDLYTFSLPQLSKIQRPVNVHFTDEGSAVLAEQVASSIESVLPKKK
jgi:hypothetical protein